MKIKFSNCLRIIPRLDSQWVRKKALLLILLSLMGRDAVAFESNGFSFEILNDVSVKITNCSLDNIENFVIPASVTYSGKTYNVTEIGEYAFRDKNFRSVVVSEGIERIESAAFLLNTVSDVVLPQSLTFLGENAFCRCDLRSINIPPNITTERGTLLFFAGGSDNTINSITIDSADSEFEYFLDVKCDTLTVRRHWSGSCAGVNHKLTFEGENLLVDVYALRSFKVFPDVFEFNGGDITLINTYIDVSYLKTSIMDVCWFTGKDLEAMDLFTAMSHKVQTVNINCNKFKSGWRTFSNFKNLKSFSVNANEMDVYRSTLAHCDELSFVDLTPFTGVQDGMFQNCVKLSELTITPGCSYINGKAFLGCSSLKKIEIATGDSHIVIGAGAFKRIPLEDLTLRRNFVAGDTPFYNIGTLTRLTLGENVKELPDYAFANCTGLREIYCESSIPPVIHPNTFKGVSHAACKVYVYDNEQGYKETDGWKEFFSGVEETAIAPSCINVTSEAGELIIKGVSSGNISIYDFGGNEIVRNETAMPDGTRFTLPAGYYIVVAGDKATKYFHNH
ncbi:MAG: leucine-rich repeat domain-containing protein [Muribaculaceae bacterium]|nr:leucine-rich repeat domain-containing protein [Muribaculaceae bacterium]